MNVCPRRWCRGIPRHSWLWHWLGWLPESADRVVCRFANQTDTDNKESR